MEGTGEGATGRQERGATGRVLEFYGAWWVRAGRSRVLEVYEVRFMGLGSVRNGSWGTIMVSTTMI